MKGFFGIAEIFQTWQNTSISQEYKLDFIAVMETGKQDMSKTNLN
jgi:hypothetical protein